MTTVTAPRATTTYSIKVDGHAEMRIEGERGTGMLYLALHVAAKESFLNLRPVTVMENGTPYRRVSVTMP